MSRYLSASISSFNVSSHTVADDRSKILPWLSPLEPRLRDQDVRIRRVDNIGGWLLEKNGFRSWCDSSGGVGSDRSGTLFCYGDPGVGKIYISSLVTDTLCDRARGRNFAAACFYFDFALQKEQAPTSILGSPSKQLVGGLDKIPEEIVEAFRDRKKVIGGQKLRLPEDAKMFQTISASQQNFTCIDALDECVPEHRLELLDSLREIVLGSPGTRIFLNGRPYILNETEKRLAGRATFPI